MKMKILIIALAVIAVTAAIFAASSKVTIPEGAEAVKEFDKERYLGRWYEIARMDIKQERGLSQVTADYSARPDGLIKVINRGYRKSESKWEEVEGKARFVRRPDLGRLKVSFFGPFYSGYNVIALDSAYRWAMVAGNDLDNLWLLSREKTMPESVRDQYLEQAKNIGYKVEELIWTEQTN